MRKCLHCGGRVPDGWNTCLLCGSRELSGEASAAAPDDSETGKLLAAPTEEPTANDGVFASIEAQEPGDRELPPPPRPTNGGVLPTLPVKEQTLIICPHCGRDNVVTARFCRWCGRSMTVRYCPRCGRAISASSRFCPSCGAPAIRPSVSSRVQPTSPARPNASSVAQPTAPVRPNVSTAPARPQQPFSPEETVSDQNVQPVEPLPEIERVPAWLLFTVSGAAFVILLIICTVI